MATVERRDKPYVWTSWVVDFLAGSKSCRWAAWHRAHFYFNKTEENDWTEHTIKHERIKTNLIKELEPKICEIFPEHKFTVEGTKAKLGGKIDVLVVNFDEKRGIVYEVKSVEKRSKHRVQCLFYMWALPKLKQFQDIQFDGMLVYEEERIMVAGREVNEDFNSAVAELFGDILTEPPRRYPAYDECKWCNIADCSERRNEPEVFETSFLIPDFLK